MAGLVAQKLVEAAGEGELRRDDIVGNGRLRKSSLRQHQAVFGDDVSHILGPRVLEGAPHDFYPDERALLGAEAVGLRVVHELVRERLAVRVGQPADVVGVEVLAERRPQWLLRQPAQPSAP